MGLAQIQAIERFSLAEFIWRHKFVFLFILFTLPVIISSFSIAIKTSNYTYPAILLGTSVINSDSLVYDNVQTLKENPSSVIGASKPEIGIYQHFKYYLHIVFFIWKLLGYIFMIIIPFTIFYWFFNLMNTSSKLKNIILSGLFGISFIFIINLLMTIVSLVNGTISLTLSGNQFTQILQIIFQTLPFHGLISLITYLVNLFI